MSGDPHRPMYLPDSARVLRASGADGRGATLDSGETTSPDFGQRAARGSSSGRPPTGSEVETHARLVVVDGPDRLLEVPLQGSILSVGRGRTSDVVLSDSAVSRTHVVLERRDNDWILCDSGSANGVLINGRRVHDQQILESGDDIEIGCSRLRFLAGAPVNLRRRRDDSTVGYPRDVRHMADGSSLPPSGRLAAIAYATPRPEPMAADLDSLPARLDSFEPAAEPPHRMPPPPLRDRPAPPPNQYVFDGHAAGEHLTSRSVDSAPPVSAPAPRAYPPAPPRAYPSLPASPAGHRGFGPPALPPRRAADDTPKMPRRDARHGPATRSRRGQQSATLVERLHLTRRNITFFAAGMALSALITLPLLWAFGSSDGESTTVDGSRVAEAAEPAAAPVAEAAPAAIASKEPAMLILQASEADRGLEPVELVAAVDDAEAAESDEAALDSEGEPEDDNESAAADDDSADHDDESDADDDDDNDDDEAAAGAEDSDGRNQRRRRAQPARDDDSRPRRVARDDGLAKSARAAYLEGDFDRAQDLLYQASDDAPSEAESRKLEDKAVYVGKLSTMQGIAARSQKSDPLVALTALEKAIALDRKLGGAHRATIVTDLQNLAVSSAKRFMARGDRESARKAAKVAERNGAGKRVESVLRSLDR